MPGQKTFPTYTTSIVQPLGGKAAAGIASGTNVVIAGVAGQTITLLDIFAVAASGASTIQLSWGTSSLNTPWTDAIPVGLASGYPQGFWRDFHDHPQVGPVGAGLIVITTGSTFYGSVEFKQGV